MYRKLNIKWFRSIDSTNLQAARELSDAPEGSVWVADYQTSGRGQRGNVWRSDSGLNLLFSVLIRPCFVDVASQFSISQITALAIVKYLKDKGLSAKIKWPNDIYVGDKKICGILIEHSVSGANLSASILGIGVNINQTVFPADAPNPTSVILESGNIAAGEIKDRAQELDRPKELESILTHLFELYEQLRDGYGEQLNAEYLSCLYRLGEYHDFIEEGNNRITARIKGINRYGCLILEKTDGSVYEYAFQQIKYVI